ncbi:hypothetical protein BC477_09410 [Clavibacter michiganensis subsp. michiganensis]|uniref:Uncharacterized protein n=1 Tax=Clavibacter michiganensis subsp. michiganensis TaxID=33013 RepID=A0A251XN66_CLAMM|nr:hypothetical protein BC477_09410 [Clavibacter michiganensis subsp. michiganensis]OUE04942.1 hypothetical protein CMMCAS07_08330 [Clavibacter michiganensis subsp. michiganensis]
MSCWYSPMPYSRSSGPVANDAVMRKSPPRCGRCSRARRCRAPPVPISSSSTSPCRSRYVTWQRFSS